MNKRQFLSGAALLAAKPLKERFESCPWALYHVEVGAT